MIASPHLAVAAQPVPAEGRSAELVGLNWFLDHPDPRYLKDVLGDMQELLQDAGSATSARTAVREAFRAHWIAGDGSGRLTLALFTPLADACAAFGPDRASLLEFFERPGVPGAWRNAAFRQWLDQNLPAAVGDKSRTERLLAGGVSTNPAAALDRYVFVREIVGPTATGAVQAWFDTNVWKRMSPAAMRDGHSHLLNVLEKLDGLARFAGEPARIRGLLGTRLFGMPVLSWAEAGEAMESLVRASQPGPLAFHQQAAEFLRGQPDVRSRSAAATVLLRLSVLTGAEAAFRQLEPGRDAPWFFWLHDAGIAQRIHDLDSNGATFTNAYELVKRFDREGHFERLFPYVSGHYYDRAAAPVFADLLRPRAAATHPRLVLESALAGKFSPEHRELLGLDCLAGGEGLASAWPGGLERLGIAVGLYGSLVAFRSAKPGDLEKHLASPLLDRVLKEALRYLRLDPAPADRVFARLDPLATHLRACKDHGGNPATSQPLLDLEARIAADLDQAMANLPADAGQGIRPEDKPRILLFVGRLRVALRIRGLVERAADTTRDWVGKTIDALRDRGFGLAKLVPGRTVYWDENTTRFRVEMLASLDDPLRECLQGRDNTARSQDRDLFFDRLYLPLTVVHGFLKLSQAQSTNHWPYLEWAKRDSACAARVFKAVQTDRWLDAEAPLLQLAALDLGRLSPWQTEPGRVFAGHWGVNANLRVWRSLLDQAPPSISENLRLAPILQQIQDEIEKNAPRIGPGFPAKENNPDVMEDGWRYFEWAENLLAAAERQQNAFRDAEQSVLPWSGAIEANEETTRPFRFRTPERAATRRVDGTARQRMWDHFWAGGSKLAPEQVRALARLALLFPNADDNLAPPDRDLAPHRRAKQAVFAQLAELWEHAGSATNRVACFRDLMLLDVSLRGAGRLTNRLGRGFEDLAQQFQNETAKDPGLNDAVTGVLAERLEILERLRDKTSDRRADARQSIDAALENLLPKGWTQGDKDLYNDSFNQRLDELSDARVCLLLKLRRRCLDVLGNVAVPSLAGRDDAVDLQRLRGCLELLDYCVWYSRPDLQPEKYLRRRVAASQGEWWPALSLLAWLNHDFQTNLLALTLRVETAAASTNAAGPPVATTVQDNVQACRELSFLLNDAILRTLVAVIADARCANMLAFNHHVVWQVWNFKLLAEDRDEEIASASTLTADAFRGVLVNLGLSTLGQPPSDSNVWERTFGDIQQVLSTRRRRQVPGMNLNGAVALATRWVDAPGVPKALKVGANTFLQGGCTRLLQGAASPQGAMRTFDEALTQSSRSPSPAYRRFFVASFTTGSGTNLALGPGFCEDLARPFFGTNVLSQRECFEQLLNGWRGRPRPEADDVLASAYHADFGRVLYHLARGRYRRGMEPYLWQPADELRKSQGILESAPADFLDLARWWDCLGARCATDRLEVTRLFTPTRHQGVRLREIHGQPAPTSATPAPNRQ
jgi:hypothetical protein